MKKIIIITFVLLSTLFPVRSVYAQSVSFYVVGGGSGYLSRTVNVTVGANSASSYNAVTVSVTFTNLTYLGASVTGGWTGVSGPSQSGNTITFSGALLGSSASGSRNILNLSFRAPSTPGSSTVSASGTIALADGSGTKVNGGGNTVYFTTVNPPPPPPPPEPAPGKVEVTSSTHPDQEKWFSSKNVTISWKKEDKVTDFSYLIDEIENTVPDDTSEGNDTSKTFNEVKEGHSYFHIKAKNNVGWGEATHFKINIDSTEPEPFAIAKLVDQETEEYIFHFYAFDKISGVKTYMVSIDGEDKGEQKSGLRAAKSIKNIEVTATDSAGNGRIASLVVKEEVVEEKIEEPPPAFDIKSSLITFGAILIAESAIAGGYLGYNRYLKKKLKKSVK